MIKYCVDTNILIYTMKNEAPAVEFMRQAESSDSEVIYSTVVEAELFSLANSTKEDDKKLRKLLDLGSLIEVSSNIALRAGQLRKFSKKLYNKKFKLPDALIAATAIEHSAILISRNVNDFAHLTSHDLQVFNPFT